MQQRRQKKYEKMRKKAQMQKKVCKKGMSGYAFLLFNLDKKHMIFLVSCRKTTYLIYKTTFLVLRLYKKKMKTFKNEEDI